MSSRNVLLVDAIAARINDAPDGTFIRNDVEAKAVFLPFVELEKATALTVLVAFGADTATPYTRAERQHTLTPQIIVACPLAQDTDPTIRASATEIAELIELAEQLADYFPTGQALGAGSAKVSGVIHDPIYDQAELHEKRRFLSIIRFSALVT